MRPIFLLALAAAVAAPTATFANTEAPSVRVAYHDLNLATDAGRDRFQRRISAAVKRVCPVADVRDLVGLRTSRRCVAETHAGMKQVMASAVKAQALAFASTPGNSLVAQ